MDRNRVFGLAGLSYFLGVLPALALMIANSYWLSAPVSSALAQELPGGIWDGVLITLALTLAAEAVFFGLFFYPVLKLGRTALIGYLIANGLAAIYSSLIFAGLADPSAQGGWGLLGLILLPAFPLILAVFLLIIGGRKLILSKRRPRLIRPLKS